jgi:hypothetical protein
MMDPVASDIVKAYPARGPLQQFRLSEGTAFECFRCGSSNKSKLITVYGGDGARRLCNGCYGRLLSLYDIKAGTAPEDEKADGLAAALLSMVASGEQRKAEILFGIAEKRAVMLSPKALRFLATAEFVAQHLNSDPQLEWSPAVIGLCKAFETEIVSRILRPLCTRMSSENLRSDKADKDIGRIATFCADPTRKPPELGAVAHFLQTVIHSNHRRQTSRLIATFLGRLADWIGSHWILSPTGLHQALVDLTSKFRNRAAHIDQLGAADYEQCREMLIGSKGMLWQLVASTVQHR